MYEWHVDVCPQGLGISFVQVPGYKKQRQQEKTLRVDMQTRHEEVRVKDMECLNSMRMMLHHCIVERAHLLHPVRWSM